MFEETKQELLAKYAEREPKRFVQFDASPADPDHPYRRDDFDDDQGDGLFSIVTVELMHGLGVRVLIDESVEPEDAVRVLRKITAWIERDGFSAANQSAEVTF